MPNKQTSFRSAEAILESITDAFYFLDGDWRFTYVNQQANILLGRESGELLGKVLWDEYPGLTGSEFETVYRRVAHDLAAAFFTSYYPDHDRWYEVHCYPVQDGMSVYFRNATERIRAEEKIRASETRFRLMTNAIPQIVWITDANGKVEFLNQQWYDYTGDATELADVPLLGSHRVHHEDLKQTMAAWELASSSGQMFIAEVRLRSAAGDYRWFLARAEAHHVGENIVQWFGTSTDIHDQKRAGEVLTQVTAESERRKRLFETVLSSTPDLAYVFDLNHRFTYANEVLLKMWGRSWDEAIGKNCLELGYEPWHAEMHGREIEQVRATGLPVRGEVPFAGSFGRRFYEYIFVPVFGPGGEVEAVAGTTRDVTERRDAEARRDALIRLTDAIRQSNTAGKIADAAVRILGEALAVSRVGYGTINAATDTLHVEREWNAAGIQNLPDVLMLRDFGSFIDDLKQGKFIAIDDVTQDLRTAIAADALIARSAGAFVNVPVIERKHLIAVLYINHADKRSWSLEDMALISEFAERIKTATGRLRSELALRESETRLREINENLEAEVSARTRELMVAEEALRHSHKMEAVGQLTGGLAHDFNNLLAGIMGSLDLMRVKMAQGKTDGIERYINVALTSVNRAAALTHRLLAFSRRQTLDPKATDANRLVGGMEELIRRTIGPAVELEVIGAGGLWTILVDAPQLENALLNLCINARDAMPDGGRLTIETANKWLDGQWASERDLLPGQYVSLCVSDTGTGMTPEVISRAFDPFFTTKPLGEGTGLGLSMVYGFARQSGGQIRIYSEVGAGTTMCIYLPRFNEGASEFQQQDAPDVMQSGGSGEVVLVVDDEVAIRKLVVEVLNDAGYETLEAANGPDALQILQSNAKIDLLITDVGLPGGLNGRQVADGGRAVRPGLKILFITGYAENAVFGNGLLEPGMQLLTKPFTMETLSRRIRESIERAS